MQLPHWRLTAGAVAVLLGAVSATTLAFTVGSPSHPHAGTRPVAGSAANYSAQPSPTSPGESPTVPAILQGTSATAAPSNSRPNRQPAGSRDEDDWGNRP